MAVNLNPGADATLVNVAYKAAMADVAPNLQPIFQQVASSFERERIAHGKMLGTLIGMGGKRLKIDKFLETTINEAVGKTKLGQKYQARVEGKSGQLYDDFKVGLNEIWSRRNDYKGLSGEERSTAKDKWKQEWNSFTENANLSRDASQENTARMANEEGRNVNPGATSYGGNNLNIGFQHAGMQKDGLIRNTGTMWDGVQMRMNNKGHYYLQDQAGNAIISANENGFTTVPMFDAKAKSENYEKLPGWAGGQNKMGAEDAFQNLTQSIQSVPKNLIGAIPTSKLEVQRFQQNLIKLGYDVGPKGDDGNFGKNTKAAYDQFAIDYKYAADLDSKITAKPTYKAPGDIGSMITYVNEKTRAGINSLDLQALKGKYMATEGRRSAIKREIGDILGYKTNDWNDAFHARLGNQKPWAEAVMDGDFDANIYAALSQIEGLEDINNDGKINKGDLVGANAAENIALVKKEMLDPTSSLAKNAFEEYTASGIINSYTSYTNKQDSDDDDDSDDNKFKYFTKEGTSGIELLGVQFGPGELRGKRNQIENGESFYIGDNTFEVDGGQWVMNKGTKEEQTFDSTQSMIKNGMGTSHEDFLSIGEPDLGGGDSKKGDTQTKLDKSQTNIIKGLFDGNTKEAKAQSTIQAVLKDYPDIANQIQQADRLNAYKLKIGEQEFNLKEPADAKNFLREINKMISGAVEQSSGSNKILDGLTKTKKEE
jgi:hypothetical protein